MASRGATAQRFRLMPDQASEYLKKKLKNPHHPVCRAMPNHEVIVAGRRHDDTVSTTTSLNSSIMQELIDTPINQA